MIFFFYESFFWNKWRGEKRKKKKNKGLYPSINLVSECFIQRLRFLYFRRDIDYFVMCSFSC